MSFGKAVRRLLPLGVVALFASLAWSDTPRMISPGDVLEISVFAGGEKQQEFTTAVSADGSISAPLLGVIRLGPTVVTQVAHKLQQRYARGYFVDPQVIVNVKEFGGRVFVAGEVRRPGMYPLGQGLTALSITDVAGGFTDFASPGRAKVSRIWNGRTQIIKVDLKRIRDGKQRDLTLQDGDRVEVPRRFF